MEQSFKIGQISKLYGVGTDTIRYYEALGLISPVRGENGYRVYSINDIWRMNVIRDLRAAGLPIEQIHEYLENRSVDSTLRLLQTELALIEEKLSELARLRDNVANRMGIIRQARGQQCGVVERKRYARRHCHEIGEGYQTDEEMDLLIKRLLNINSSRLYLIGNNRIGSWLNMNAVKEGEYRCYTAVFIIDEHGGEVIEGGEYISISYRGDCAQNKVYIPRLLAYAAEHRLRLAGGILELLWIDIHEASDVREHVTELQARVIPYE